MIRHLRCTSVTAFLIICVVGVFVQVNTSAAQNRHTRIGYQRYRRRHVSKPPCLNGIRDDDDNFSSLETKIRETEFVFTGKVTAEIPPIGRLDPWKRSAATEDGASKFSVRVKRVLKGELQFRDGSVNDWINANQMTVKIRTVDEPKTLKDCYKRPIGVHHTAIFLAKRVDDATMQLTSDPLPLTLRNLDKVNAAVKGKMSACHTRRLLGMRR
ncbi:uncharacterized protein LOC111862436 [Cryptotermes secundus]|uniref:uncharacterized protein LOC111862436 n=1 Tax=Cryptotermes secundus TaxID=105785 RepID=UPI001454D4B3|nr:uncharacterized protein LOC111862436 [Cryptotermes secundus]